MGYLVGIDGRPANDRTRVGIGRLCHEFLRAAPRVAGDASLIVYLDAPPNDDFPLLPSQAVIRVLPRARFWTQRALASELRRSPPDVYYSTTLQLPVFCSCPKVATVLDLAFYDFGEYFPWVRRTRARLESRMTVSRASRLVAISEATRDDVVTRFGLPPGRVAVARPGVSERFLPGADASARARVRDRYKLPERYVLYVGRLQPRKNLVRLVHAFERLVAAHPELTHGLVIAGASGWMQDEIHEAIVRSPVSARIIQTGYVEEADLPEVMAAADVLALVSLWEGFGLPLLEAMQAGAAVLTSNCSSMPEVTGDAGVVVDPYDEAAIAHALERLLLDGEYRDACVQRGYDRAREFTWERFAKGVFDVLRGAAGRVNTPRDSGTAG